MHKLKGCSPSENHRRCIYTKKLYKDHRFGSDNLKTANMGTLYLYSAIYRCALFVLGPNGAEVAWHVALRSLICHMGTSYLARRTGYSTQDLSKRGAPAL